MWPNKAALIAAAFAALFANSAAKAVECADDRVVIRAEHAQTGQTTHSFQVEIADDAKSRARGLMFRHDLPQGRGMLFIYPQPGPLSFWMRNTFIPLDILFVDDRGIIRHIHADARPMDETPIPGALPEDSDPDRLMVLEIAGGEAARLNLQPGQAMAHPRLPQDRAALPCS